MSLYNCKASGSSYRLTKFTNDLEVEASYLTNGRECDCPAGHRPVCRHRIMLPRFIAKNATAGQWFHNYEHQQWIRAAADDEADTLGDLASTASELTIATEITLPDDATSEDVANTFAGLLHKQDEPKPINLLALADRPEPYGIGPAITNDLPVIREYNEAKREQLVKAEQLRIEAKPLRRL